VDKLDQVCSEVFERIKAGTMTLEEFICFVADQNAEAFGEGRDSAEEEGR